MEKLVRKSKISDEESIFSDYIRYPEKYDECIKKFLNQLNIDNIEDEKNRITDAISDNLKEAIFTSGATEYNNITIKEVYRYFNASTIAKKSLLP